MPALWEDAGLPKDILLIVPFYENIIKEMKDAYNSLYDLVIILKDKIDYIENPIELCIPNGNENNMTSDFEVNFAHTEKKKKNNTTLEIVDDINCSDKKMNLYNTDKLNNILCNNSFSPINDKNEKEEITNSKNMSIDDLHNYQNNEKELLFCEKKNDMINYVHNNFNVGYYSEGVEIGNTRKRKKKKKKSSENKKTQQVYSVDEIKNIINMNCENDKIKETIKKVKLLKGSENNEVLNEISNYNNFEKNNLANLENGVEEKGEPNQGDIKIADKNKKINNCAEYFSDLNFSDNSIDSNKIRILNLVNENKMLSKILNKKKKYYENIIFKNIRSGNNLYDNTKEQLIYNKNYLVENNSEKNNHQNLNPFFAKSLQNEFNNNENKNKVTNIYSEQIKDTNIPYSEESSEINFKQFRSTIEQNKTFEKDKNKHNSLCNDTTHECANNLCRHYASQDNFKINYLENGENKENSELKDKDVSIINDKEKEKGLYTCDHQKNYLDNCCNNNINKEEHHKENTFQKIKFNNNFQNKCVYPINNNACKNMLNYKLKNEQRCNECYSLFLKMLKGCEKIKFIEMNKQNANQKETHLNCIYDNQYNLGKNVICCHKCGEVYNIKDVPYFDTHNESKTEIQKSVLLLNSDIYHDGNESSETVIIGNEENDHNLFKTNNIENISDGLKKSESYNFVNSNIKYIPEYYYSNINNKIVLNKNVIIQRNGYITDSSNLVTCHCAIHKNGYLDPQLPTIQHEVCASASQEICEKKCEKNCRKNCGKRCQSDAWKVGGAPKPKMDSQENLYKIVSYKNVIKNTLPSNYIDVDVNPFRVPYKSIGSFLSCSNYMGRKKRRKIKKKKLRKIGKKLCKRHRHTKCDKTITQDKTKKPIKKNVENISEELFNADFSDIKSSNMSSEKLSIQISKENLLDVENKMDDTYDTGVLNSFEKKIELNDKLAKKQVDKGNNKVHDLGKSEMKENGQLGNEKKKANKRSKKKYLEKGEKNRVRKKVCNKQKYYENNKTILYLEDRDKTYLSEYNEDTLSVKKKNFENEPYTKNSHTNKYELREKRKIKYILPSINKKLRRDSSRQIFDPFLYNNTWAIKKV
ncbi:hypothetical protein YYG_04253 [Plasmodium vinckei petteri]|uniref:Uncharacterized protein n=1 Tax=Plasmodium vinckei petteri TaxID=138298 RepID=W7AG42_PLAVN|nr:hypothetical protein YYG_04253 [Plasmodium vinckei petteri]CAD2101130.1 conserved Plasmodium protein, unknown function [Plasmodium vinckei petteri]